MPRWFSPAAICLNDAGLTRRGEQAMPAALCALSNAVAPRRAWRASLRLWSGEGTMANQAKEARARLEASFRKQHEAERAAAKNPAEHDADARDTPVGRDRDNPQSSGGSVGQKGGRQGGWS